MELRNIRVSNVGVAMTKIHYMHMKLVKQYVNIIRDLCSIIKVTVDSMSVYIEQQPLRCRVE
jgi:hypothetical protein